MKPHVTCVMLSCVDGRLHASRWTKSPDGDPKRWSQLYEDYQATLGADGWLVGRTTMAEMAKGTPHPIAEGNVPARPLFKAKTSAPHFAIALDTAAKLHFDQPTIQGNQVLVVLGAGASDDHLRELQADGISYFVAATPAIDPVALLTVLASEFGIRRLALEGGAEINGSFFAAGLVDEFHVIVGPAIDARRGAPGIVEHGDDGLAGRIELEFGGCEVMDLGCVLLRYAVRHGATQTPRTV